MLYNKRPTLAKMYAENDAILDGLNLPESLSLSDMKSLLLMECGELETVCADDEALALYLPVWSRLHVEAWERIEAVLAAEYNPIHNYDRTDTETETTEDSETGTGSENSTGTGSSTETASGTNTREMLRQGFNSSDYVPSDKEIQSPATSNSGTTSSGLTRQLSDSRSREGERVRELHSSGNIGVTTAQQMIEAELAMRNKWTLAGVILQAFKSEICVGVW